MAWEEKREQFEEAAYGPLAHRLRSPKEGISPNNWGFYFGWERPGVGIGCGLALTKLWMTLVRVQTTGMLKKGMLSSTTCRSPTKMM